ncbi:MAG: hypothetical protein NXI22_13650, partial [bacterium]|nr:hypothetical protein [bacterium]
MADKITISLDEIHSDDVDDKLRQQAAMRTDDDPGAGDTGSALSQLLYHTLVYTALFGLVGGVLAGVVGEIFFFAAATPLDAYESYLQKVDELSEEYYEGDMTDGEFDREMERLDRRYEGNPFIDEDVSGVDLDILQGRYSVRSLVNGMIWFCGVGMALAFFLSIADPFMSQNNRSVLINGSVAVAIGLVGSFFGFLLASIVYGRLGGGDASSIIQQILARAIGWGIIGGFLALAPGVVLKNVKRSLIGLIGGLVGGTLGGMLFDPIAIATGSDELSRMV